MTVRLPLSGLMEQAVNEKLILMLMLLGAIVLLANGRAWRAQLRRGRPMGSPQV